MSLRGSSGIRGDSVSSLGDVDGFNSGHYVIWRIVSPAYVLNLISLDFSETLKCAITFT